MRIQQNAVIATIGATLLASCALGPDYKRPSIETPGQYRAQTEEAGTDSFGDVGWWTVYQDPTLQALLRTALENNLDLRIAATRVEQAQAALGVARLGQVPRISAGAGATRQERSDAQGAVPGLDRINSQYSASLNLSFELDFWGRLRRASESARAQVLATEYGRQAVRAGLVSEVATAYFTLIALDEQLEITRGTMETREQFLRLTRAQFDRGVVSGLDVSTAEAQLATARASVPDLERQLAQQENQLSVLLGRNPGPVLRQTRDISAVTLAPQTPAGLPSRLLERRPDLLQAEQGLVSANAQVGVAKAAMFPSISLTGSYGSLSLAMSDLFTNASETWSVGVNLLQPLLDADRNLYRIDQADAARRQALLEYEKTVRTAFQEVADALVGRQKSAEFEAAQNDLVAAQSRSEQIALARYKSGYSSYFDVINADRDLFNAKLVLSRARLESLLSSVQLYRALGGGWQVQESTETP